MARYKKTVSGALWVHLVLLICYQPYTIATFVVARSGLSLSNVAVWNIAAILVYINSSYNPVLYGWKIREVRQAVKATIRHICS